MEGKGDRCRYQYSKTGGCGHTETWLIAPVFGDLQISAKVFVRLCVCARVYLCVDTLEDFHSEMRYLLYEKDNTGSFKNDCFV